MRGSRNLEDLKAHLLELGAHKLGQLTSLRHVNFVQHHNLRTLVQRHGHARGRVDLVVLQLAANHLEVANRVTAGLQSRAVNHVHERRGALHVTQEAVAQATPLRSALNQTRHVGHGVAHIARLNHAQVRD